MNEQELRELDAWIAERVMGLTWDETRCRVCGWPTGHCTADSCSMRPVPKVRADEPPRYTTDIAAAWQVVERLRLQGVWLAELSGRYEHSYRAGFAWRDAARGLLYVQKMASTAPLAICLAARKALDARSALEARDA